MSEAKKKKPVYQELVFDSTLIDARTARRVLGKYGDNRKVSTESLSAALKIADITALSHEDKVNAKQKQDNSLKYDARPESQNVLAIHTLLNEGIVRNWLQEKLKTRPKLHATVAARMLAKGTHDNEGKSICLKSINGKKLTYRHIYARIVLPLMTQLKADRKA